MIAACPKCQTRYRVEPERLGPEGARLRCSQCSAMFRVRLPAEQAAPAPAPVDQVTPGDKAHASDTAALGGVARSPQGAASAAQRAEGERSSSNWQASEAHKDALTRGNQALSAEGRSVP